MYRKGSSAELNRLEFLSGGDQNCRPGLGSRPRRALTTWVASPTGGRTGYKDAFTALSVVNPLGALAAALLLEGLRIVKTVLLNVTHQSHHENMSMDVTPSPHPCRNGDLKFPRIMFQSKWTFYMWIFSKRPYTSRRLNIRTGSK